MDRRGPRETVRRTEFTGLGRYVRLAPARPTALFGFAEIEVRGTR